MRYAISGLGRHKERCEQWLTPEAVVVREDINGNWYYNHDFVQEKKLDSLAYPASATGGGGNHPTISGPNTHTIVKPGGEVKGNPHLPDNVRSADDSDHIIDDTARQIAAKFVKTNLGQLGDLPAEEVAKLVSGRMMTAALRDVGKNYPGGPEAFLPIRTEAAKRARQLISDARKTGFDQALGADGANNMMT